MRGGIAQNPVVAVWPRDRAATANECGLLEIVFVEHRKTAKAKSDAGTDAASRAELSDDEPAEGAKPKQTLRGEPLKSRRPFQE
ncbi:MAG: hypothetical protein ACKOCX_01915 [Planctomycetota bacterium]